jgi:hypothetical protein
MLQTEQPLLSPLHAFDNVFETKVDPSKPRLRRLLYHLRIT